MIKLFDRLKSLKLDDEPVVSSAPAGKVLTIVVPAYNVAEYLPRGLNSLLSSKHLDLLEVLVVDDGSTDGIQEACAAFVVGYPGSFRLISKENGHYGSAVNRGIQEATGRYLKIMDGDDSFDTEALDALLGALMGCTTDLVLTDYVLENADTADEEYVSFSCMPCSVLSLESVTDAACDMHACCYRTALLQEHAIMLDTGVLYTDVEFVLFPIPFVESVYYLPLAVYRHRVGHEGQSMDPEVMDSNAKQHFIVLYRLIVWFHDTFADDKTPAAHFCARRIARMVDEHADLCLTSANAFSHKDDMVWLAAAVKANPKIERYCTNKALLLLFKLRGHFYPLVAAAVRSKTKRTDRKLER